MLIYVFCILNPFWEICVVHSLEGLEHSSKLVSRLFLRKTMFSFSVLGFKTSRLFGQNTVSSTSRCNISFNSLGEPAGNIRFARVFAFDTWGSL